jgi:hypothetical protein
MEEFQLLSVAEPVYSGTKNYVDSQILLWCRIIYHAVINSDVQR